jgi:FkbM family methyltransferase
LLLSLGVFKPLRVFYNRFVCPENLEIVRRDTATFASFVRPGDLCFDVGANIGRKSEALLALGARVVAVEPQPWCVRELKAMLGGDPRFRYVQTAVGSRRGAARLHVSSLSGLSSLRSDWFGEPDSEIDVEVTTLDRLIAEHGVPRFCKIDVEGLELEVLRGLTQPVEYIAFEYNTSYLDQMTACVEYLKRFGPLSFNFSLAENPPLLSEGWWDHDTFLRRFHEALHRHEGTWGGDVFVKVGTAAA